MALSREQSIALYGSDRYTGWPELEASYDAQARGITGGGSSGYGSDTDNILSTAVNTYLPLFNKIKPYEEVNPFIFDEKLAEQASTAEYAPYYGELLSDYIAKVEKTKSRSGEDLKKILEQLSAGKEYYLGAERRALDRAIRSTNEGYAGRGLFFSGARQRDVRELTEESGFKTGNYLGKYEYATGQAKTTAQRETEDVDWARRQYERDIEREKKYAIKSGVLQRKEETRTEYELAKKKYYEGEFAGYA